MEITISSLYATDPETFWNEVFFDTNYNRRLYEDILEYDDFRLVRLHTCEQGYTHREIHVRMNVEAPGFISKVLHQMVFIENGKFDPAKQKWNYTLVPSVAKDRVKISGDSWLSDEGNGTIEHFVRFNVQVKAPGIGRMVEKFIVNQIVESHHRAHHFTKKHIENMQVDKSSEFASQVSESSKIRLTT